MCPWLTKQVQLNVFASTAILRETGLNSPPGNHDRQTSMGSTLLSPQQCEAADPVECKHMAAPASSGAGGWGGGGGRLSCAEIPIRRGPRGVGQADTEQGPGTQPMLGAGGPSRDVPMKADS